MAVSLSHLQPGDFFFGETDFDGKAICLVTDVGKVVRARQIAMQLALKFDPDTGKGNTAEGDYSCHVTSVEQPPEDVRGVLLGLDHRYGSGCAPTLSKEERRALLWWDR